MNQKLPISITSELQHGISVDDISGFQVLVLPENFNNAPDKDSLIEASDSLNMSKIFKEEGIKCANSFDLGLDVPALERRGSDIWLGQILVIDNVVLPLIINLLTAFIQNRISKRSKKQDESTPKEKVHVELKMHKNGNINKLNYNGDGETLVSLLKTLKTNE